MRLVLRLFGVTVIDLDASDSLEPADDWADLSGGTLASIPVGFMQPEPSGDYEDDE